MSSNNANAPPSNNLVGSMKQLEKDLDIFRSIYDEELKLMRLELEELESSRNQLQLNNYNLEVKLKDFIIKFEDIKKTNQDLVNELNESKAKCNRIDFDLGNTKLELEKVTRENAQYKKDVEDLLNKLNEKQILLDNQFAYSQNLELKFRELNQTNAFEKLVNKKEIESLKNKLTVSQESLDKLEGKTGGEENIQSGEQVRAFRHSPADLNRSCSMQDLFSDPKHVQESRAETTANMSKEISSGSKVKFDSSPLESKNENEARLFNENIWLKSQNEKLNEQNAFLMGTCKEMEETISNLESALDRIKAQFNSINNTERLKLTVNTSLQNFPAPTTTSNDLMSTRVGGECEKKKPIGPISPFSRGPKSISMPTRASVEAANDATKPPYMSDNSQHSSTLASLKNNVTKSSNLASDYTNDLFKNFESATLMERNYTEPYSSSTIDNAVTEASYTGNVKIHEVNKNGYYIRLLNVSDKIDEDLSNYTIQQMVSTMPVAVYRLPASLKIKPGHTITIWSRTDEVDPQPPHTFVWYEQDKWGTGPECTTILAKPNGQAVSWTTGCHKYGNIDYDEIVPVYSNKRNRSALGSVSFQLNRQKLSPKTIYTPTKHPHGSIGLSASDKSTKSMSNINLFNSAADLTERNKPPESYAIKSNYFRDYKAQSNRSKASSVTIRGTFSGSTSTAPTRPQTCIGAQRSSNIPPRAKSSSHKPKGNSNETSNDEDYIYQVNYMYQNED